MPSPSVDKIVQIYRQLCDIPALISARFLNIKTGLQIEKTVVESVWSQRNLERGKTVKFQKNFVLQSDNGDVLELGPRDVTNELLSSISQSGQHRAVLREVDNRQYLEVWRNNYLARSVDLAALDLHGNVYTDGEFDTFQWSPCENKLVYLAEEKPPKTEPFYKRTGKKQEETIKKGEEFLFSQDWGEQLVGKRRPVIAEYNVLKDNVVIFNGIPEDVCPAQVLYTPDQSCIIGVAYKSQPRKLGLVYCTNRLGTIFGLDFEGNYCEIPLGNKSVKSPRISRDGGTLVWLQREAGGPHAAAMALMKTDLPLSMESKPVVVVDIVRNCKLIGNDATFYGLYNSSLPKRCFSGDNRLVLSTIQMGCIKAYIVEIDSGRIFEIEYEKDSSQVVLDVDFNRVLINRRNFLKPDQLVVLNLPDLSVFELTAAENIMSKLDPKDLICENMFMVHDTDDECKSFTAFYVGPKTAPNSDDALKLIVWPHGGPHSAFASNFSLEVGLFLSMGYAVLLVNYRGSIGAGQDSVDFLLGKIGRADVDDCCLAVEHVIRAHPFLSNAKKALVGGSHGGFLVAHLSGQFPDYFKAVVARNPVIDVASMSITSDIPDWCYVEAGKGYSQAGEVDNKLLLAMRNASPIQKAHKVKAPTLLQIGSKDLRVPPQQGLEYYTRLKANGVVCQMNLYDDNHPLGTVPNEMDNVINTVLWIEKHCS